MKISPGRKVRVVPRRLRRLTQMYFVGRADLASGIWVGGWILHLESCILNLAGCAGAVHSAHKEAAMEEQSLTLGAHLLLWVFPLLLVVVVIIEDLLDRRKREPGR